MRNEKIREDDKFNFQGGVVMITLRGIGVFIFSALLTGSPAYSAVSPSEETPKCVAPGKPSATSCYYKLTITHIDRKSGLVKGKVPRTVVEENKRDNPDLDITKYRFDEYSFKVKDLETLKVGSEYEFDSVPNTNELKIRK